MAQSPGGDEIQRSAYKRVWVQRGGPRPANPLRYAGADGSYVEVGDVTSPQRTITKEENHDPAVIGGYRTVGVIRGPSGGFPTNQVMFKNKRGVLPWTDFDQGCDTNLYLPVGYCRSPGDFSGGWESGVQILSKGVITSAQKQGLAKFSEDVASIYMAEMTWTGGEYTAGPLFFGEAAQATITREAVDAVFADAINCPNCGPGNDGASWQYVLEQGLAGSASVPARVVYTTDGWATDAAAEITGAGADVFTALDILNGYLIALSETGNSYFYSQIDPITGVPGAWAEVSSGFVGGATPNDLFVVSPTLALIAGENGYVYRLRRPGQAVEPVLSGGLTSEDLLRINGNGETVVATGTNGTIIVSRNAGGNWASVTGPSAITDDFTALEVIDPYLWWLGSDAGNLYVTETGGQGGVWTQQTFDGDGAGVVTDIVAATAECLYFAHSTAAPVATLWASITGGERWDASSSAAQRRLGDVPAAADRFNRIAAPRVGSLGSRANHVLIAGLGGNGTDGIVLAAGTSIDFGS